MIHIILFTKRWLCSGTTQGARQLWFENGFFPGSVYIVKNRTSEPIANFWKKVEFWHKVWICKIQKNPYFTPLEVFSKVQRTGTWLYFYDKKPKEQVLFSIFRIKTPKAGTLHQFRKTPKAGKYGFFEFFIFKLCAKNPLFSKICYGLKGQIFYNIHGARKKNPISNRSCLAP